MQYEYEAIDATGQAVRGQIDAQSPAEVVRQLGLKGHTAVGVSERQPPLLPTLQRRLRSIDVVIALRELATLLGSGVSLGDAVAAQSRGSSHPRIGQAFAAIGTDLTRGQSFLQALRGSSLPLPDYLLHLVEAGETSGRLAQSLTEAVEQMEYDRRVAADMRGALAYPALLVVMFLGVVALMFTVVVPNFEHLLDGDIDLPWLAAAVLHAGVWFNDNTLLLAGLAAGAVATAYFLLQRGAVRRRLVDAIGSAPVLREWFLEADTAKWASVMGAMLASRVELMDALRLATQGVRISRRRRLLEQALADVRGGNALSEALERQSALTPTGYNLIRVGEQSGELAKMMRSLAGLYEENSARRMKRVLVLVEPLAILLIGGALGTIMIGLILAFTSVNEIAL